MSQVNRIVPIASGKGGVGKSILTANLGVSLASLGLKVVLIDLDLGASNLHSLVGVQNSKMGIGGYAHKGASRLEDLMDETPYQGLSIITGDALLPGSANIPWWFKKRILGELAALPADMTLIDLGAGSSYNTIDFFLSSRRGFVVTTPEPTAMVNGYSFLKNAYYRLLFRLFPSRTPERDLIRHWAYENRDRGEGAAIELFDALEKAFPGAGRKAKSLVDALHISVLLNDYHEDKESESWHNLVSVSEKNLGISLSHLGSIPHDPDVRISAFSRVPAVVAHPDGDFSREISSVAARLAQEVH